MCLPFWIILKEYRKASQHPHEHKYFSSTVIAITLPLMDQQKIKNLIILILGKYSDKVHNFIKSVSFGTFIFVCFVCPI